MSDIPEITGSNAEYFKIINVGGIFGGVRPGGLNATIYSESEDIVKVLETPNLSASRTKIKRVAECELRIDPMQMKSIHDWLGTKIKEFEKLFGTIPSPEEVQSRHQRENVGQ